jgi:molecular chaperone GrpE
MTKKKGDKRRIRIEDKRSSSEPAAPENGIGKSAADHVIDEKLKEFSEQPVVDNATAGHSVDAVDSDQAAGLRQQAAGLNAVSDETNTGEIDWKQQAAEYLDRFTRKEAELQNYRKLVQKDLAAARRFAVEGLLSDLFPAFDGLAQAAATFKDKADGADPLLDGVRRTVKSLEKALQKHGIEKINDAPVPFDPEFHQVLNLVESGEVTEETVAEVYVEGYRLGDTVLKPAMVRVLKPEE